MRFSISIIVFLLLGALFLVGAIFLQIFLSKKENKWYGLILPGITMIVSLFYCMNIMATGSFIQDIILIVTTLLLANIPTGILLIIYFICRDGLKKKSQIDKMKIHDLQ